MSWDTDASVNVYLMRAVGSDSNGTRESWSCA